MTTYPCPACGGPAGLEAGCPGCGRAPDPDAAEVIRLDAQLPVLAGRLVAAKAAVVAAENQLRDTRRRRDAAAYRVRLSLGPAVLPPPQPASPTSLPQPAPTPATRTPEASTRLVQNALFLLGGLLLGVAAIVFTAVAWATFGVGGRAVVLVAITAVALALPLVALRRRLTATAETIAAVGLLLVALDGYAAWSVDLFGVPAGSASRYAAVVLAVTAAVAAGYAHLTGLTGPRYAAVLAAQPVLALLVAPTGPGAAGWSVALTGTAALHLLLLRLLPRPVRSAPDAADPTVPAFRPVDGVRVLAWLAGGGWLVGGMLSALAAEVLGYTATQVAAAGTALMLAALVGLAAARLGGSGAALGVAAAALVVASGVALGRGVLLLNGAAVPLAAAGVAAVLAAAVRYAGARLPHPARSGARAGALVVVGVPALVAVLGALAAAGSAIRAARPWYAADRGAVAGATGSWWLPITLLLLAVGAVLLLPAARAQLAAGVAALVAVSLPAALHLPWWTAPAVDLPVAAALLLTAVRSARPATVAGHGVLAAGVAGHALLTAAGQPAVHAAAAAALVALGLLAAARAGTGSARVVGGLAAAAALPLVPVLASAVVSAVGADAAWTGRGALTGLLVLPAAHWLTGPVHRRYTYGAVLLTAATAPLWALATGDATVVYAATAVLVVAVAHDLHRRTAAPRVAADPTDAPPAVTAPLSVADTGAVVAVAPPALWLLIAALPAVVTVLAAPYGELSRIWAGVPAPIAMPAGSGPVAVALAIAGLAAVAPVRRAGRGPLVSALAPLAALTLLVGLGAAGIPWPVLPAVSLLVGLGGVLGTALRRRSAPDATAAGGVALLIGGAGLAGALPLRWSTLAALGLCVVTATVCGAAGRTALARTGGRLGMVAAAVLLALAAAHAADLPRGAAAYAVLAVAALALLGGTLLTARAARDAVAVQAAAHAAAAVALLLDAAAARTAAAVLALWGLALGLRALWPGETPAARRLHCVAAATAELLSLWVLLHTADVTLVEAYTVPAAAVGVLGGWLALRGRPSLGSWQAYGPALAAGLLPSLGLVLASDGQPVRRLVLGLAALAVVVAGARHRLQAPVVVGGSVLAVVALHELARLWDLLPRWIPLAAGGIVLVGLAMTVERRRRDLIRVRTAVGRMT